MLPRGDDHVTDLQTDNAMTGVTRYILGPERASDGVHVELDHQAGIVDIGEERVSLVTLSAAEALGLLDVLTHERERLQQWVREEAG